MNNLSPCVQDRHISMTLFGDRGVKVETQFSWVNIIISPRRTDPRLYYQSARTDTKLYCQSAKKTVANTNPNPEP